MIKLEQVLAHANCQWFAFLELVRNIERKCFIFCSKYGMAVWVVSLSRYHDVFLGCHLTKHTQECFLYQIIQEIPLDWYLSYLFISPLDFISTGYTNITHISTLFSLTFRILHQLSISFLLCLLCKQNINAT